MAAAGYQLGLTPDVVTLLSACFTASAFALVALVTPSWYVAVVSYFLAVLGFALDSADGQLARLRGGGSAVGEWFDHVADCAKMVWIHSAILICFYRFYHVAPGILVIVIAYQLLSVVSFFSGILVDQLKRQRTRKSEDRAASGVRALVLLPLDYGVFCLLLLLLGWRIGFVVAYVGLFAFRAVLFPVLQFHWACELRQLPAR